MREADKSEAFLPARVSYNLEGPDFGHQTEYSPVPLIHLLMYK